MKGVLEGFIGTYVSRYSDYDGYWLFGFLVPDHQRLRIDLLSNEACSVDDAPQGAATALARAKFRDQVTKAALPFGTIHTAKLDIVRQPGTRKGYVNVERDGYDVLFKVTATMDNGRVYERQRSVFVSPHDASIERRSGELPNPRMHQAPDGDGDP